jgi:hypothetical protein
MHREQKIAFLSQTVEGGNTGTASHGRSDVIELTGDDAIGLSLHGSFNRFELCQTGHHGLAS